nr:hypothetical protein [Tanacetum cinerariifolium]
MLAIQAEEGKGSRHPSEPQPPPSTAQPTNEEPIPNVASTSHQKTQTPNQALTKVTKLPQTSEPIPNVADEAIYEDPMCQEAMGGSIAQTKSERVPTPSYDLPLLGIYTPESDEERFEQHELTGNVQQQSNDLPLSRGHTLGNGEDSIELIKELMETYTKLSEQVLALEESKTAQDLVITRLKLRVKKLEKKKKKERTPHPLKRRLFKVRVESYADENLEDEDPSKQGTSMIEEIDQDAGAHSQEYQPEDQLGVLSAAEVLADAARNVQTYTRRRRAISTGSGAISTASRLFSTIEESVSTASALMPVSEDEQTKRIKLQQEQGRLGYEAAVRLQEELDEEERQRMARVHEAAQSFNKEEWENNRSRVEPDDELAQRLQAEERNKYSEFDKAKMLVDLINQRKRYFALKKLSFDEINKLFKTTMKIVNTFVPMETEVRGRASELAAGSSQATITDSKEVGSSKRAAKAKLDYEGSKRQKTNEASGSVQEQPDEKENELSQEYLQQMMMVKIISVGNHTEAYQFFDDMLKAFDMDDLVMLWSLVKERFSSTKPTNDKERTVWVELKRLFEPNIDDTLWKLQRYMHDPLTWRLYDTCGVHHVSTDKGMDIFMLVEKEYPLSKGVLTLMLVNKLLVDQHSDMANKLLRKIFIQASRLKH